MQRSTFKVLFYVKRQAEKSGQVPVMGRITINGTMSQFSCKLTVRSSLWDAKANKAAGRSLESQRINEKLENIKTNIGKQYQRLCDRSLRLKSSPSVIASSMRGVGHTDASEKTVCMCLSFKGLISVDVGNDDPMSIASIEKILQMELTATFGMDV